MERMVLVHTEDTTEWFWCILRIQQISNGNNGFVAY